MNTNKKVVSSLPRL